MKILKSLLWIVLLVVVLFFLVALFLPGEAVHKKQVTIDQPVESIFQWILLLENESMDTIGEKGQASGMLANVLPGARIEMVDMVLEEHIDFVIHHDNLGEVNSRLDFTELDQGTQLTQTINLRLSYPTQRYIYMFLARSQVDHHLEKGLQSIKQLARVLPSPGQMASKVEIDEMSSYGAQPTITLKDSAKTSELTAKAGKTFEELYAYFDKTPAMLADGPFIFFHSYDPDGYTHYEAVLVLTSELEGNSRIRPGKTYEGRSLVTSYNGSLKYKKATWEALEAHRKERQLEKGGTPFGVYRTDPVKVQDPREISMDLYLPVKE